MRIGGIEWHGEPDGIARLRAALAGVERERDAFLLLLAAVAGDRGYLPSVRGGDAGRIPGEVVGMIRRAAGLDADPAPGEGRT